MPADLSIRPLATGDAEGWRRLWAGYLDFYRTTLPEAVWTAQWARLTGPEPRPVRGLVAAEGDGSLVGLAHYILHPHGWTVGPVCYLQDLWTDPAARRRGIGRRLIEAVYAEAGAEQVYWLTATDNAVARRLYDRIGRATPFMKYQRR